MVDLIREHGTERVVVLPTLAPPKELNERFAAGSGIRVADEILALNETLGGCTIPFAAGFDDGLDRDGDWYADAEFFDDFESETGPDLVHPDRDGDAATADAVVDLVESRLAAEG